jgi:hypothetical protein
MIPEELKNIPQWICWNYKETGPDTKPTKLPINPKTGQLASVTNSSTWGTFQEAIVAAPFCSGLGFVLTSDSGYSCIDLDHTENEADRARQVAIYNAFESYAEISPSGKGCHIWIKGTVPSGRRRGCVEIYSNERYMTFTGQPCRNIPVMDHSQLIMQLWDEMSQNEKVVSTCDKPQTQTDNEILLIASQAANGQKVIDLYEGRWADYYPSQSEADFALVDIIAFYSHNREQITRIFRNSALGARQKAKRNQYVEYMLNRCFDRMLPEVDVDGLRNQIEAQLQASKAEAVKRQAEAVIEPVIVPQPEAVKVKHSGKKQHYTVNDNFKYTVPPGLIGEIAKFIHDAAPRPVPEIAIAGAIGLMSGVCGRSYNISGTGLNQYVLILAMTGAGKESCATGIDKLITETIKTVPAASEFIGPGEIASPQALMKYMSKTSNCFMSLVGEFGMKFKQLCDVRASSNEIGLKRIFLDLYNKSGTSSILKPLIYSDKDKNTEPIKAPSFSMLGETTPETFYENLNGALISDGLLPRFTIIEYKGKRPQLNENHLHVQPSAALLDQFSALCAYSLQLNNGNNALNVQIDDDALQLFKDFDKHCDYQINHASNDVTRQLWNRAHIKSLKLAALLAVGCNYINPIINVECAKWSLDLIVNDAFNLLGRFESGTIGANNLQNEQTLDIKKALRKYVTSSWEELTTSNGATLNTWAIKVIPHSYISAFCRQRASFKNDRLGPVQALKTCIAAMIECDEIKELNPNDKRQKSLALNSRCYMITDLSKLE